MEFPSNALTNFTIVNDFAEIVYLVCLALTSPAGGPDQVVPSSPVHTASEAASRLKEAEREFREIGILTAIDPDKGELFTFWRKPDLQRDGPSVLGKVGVILRARSCRVSYRSGTRAVDLLHPGQSRLYRLFIGAILRSIRQALLKNHGLLPLGQTTFAREVSSDHTVDEEFDGKDSGDAALLDTRLQLLPIGQLILTIEDISGIFLRRVTASTAGCKLSNGAHGDIVLLAPAGIIARLPKSDETHESQKATPPRERGLWESELEQWMTDQGLQDWNDKRRNFVEVQIPTRRSGGQQESLPGGAGTGVHWKTVSWPEHMCFSLVCLSTSKEDANSLVTGITDPLQFAEEWFLGAEARTKRIHDKQASAKEEPIDAASTDLSPTGGLVFEHSPMFHRNMIAELQNANNIYPTPPDGALSQVTPGMSSMDGIGATPAEVHRIPPERGGSADDHDMDDLFQGQESDPVVGTGTYDEDLFGEMPTSGYGESGIADEPNWDFFDEQDLDMTDDPANLPLQPVETSHADATADISMTPGQDDDVESQNALPQRVFDGEGLGLPASAEVKTDVTTGDIVESPAFEESAGALELATKEPLERKHNNADTALSSDVLSDELPTTVEQSETWRAPNETSTKLSTPGQSRRLLLPDEKYGANGRFWFGGHNADAKSTPSARHAQAIPRLGTPRKSSKPKPLAPTDPSEQDESSGSENADAKSSLYSDASDFSNSNHESDRQAVRASDRETNRRWTEYMPTSPKADANEQVFDERETRGLAREILEGMPMEVSVSALTKFCYTRGEAAVSSYDGDNGTMLAQIVVDQLTQSSLTHGLNEPPKPSSTVEAVAAVAEILSDTYGMASRIELVRLASLSAMGDMNDNQILNIDHFNVSLRREDKSLLASSTAMSFWESLNLQPASGAKDITAFCVHPDSTNIASGCRNFLERTSETYEHCSLGGHIIGKIAGTTNDGLVTWSEDDSALPTMLQTCQRLGVALSKLSPSNGNIVIYIINPESAPTSVGKVGSAFIALWSAYVKACGKQKPNEVALQIVPVSFLASPDTVVVRPQADYLKLAVEIYNRCPPVRSEDRVAACGSAAVLAESTERKLQFDLAVSAQSPFAKDGRSLHLAYSQSIDGRWITAAWTDPNGHTALTMSYSVRQRGSTVSRPLSEIIHAMWEVSMDLMRTTHSKWRLIVAKAGLISALEFNEWSIHANQDSASSSPRTPGLLLLSVNIEPSLALDLPSSPAKAIPGSASQQQAGIYGTPSSTPYASTTSPEQMAAGTPTPSGFAPSAPTPPDPSYDASAETDLTLTDPLDETWSVVLSHGLNQSESIFEARPALASGYLLKRQGALDSDGLAILEVSVVHAPKAAPSAHQELLREVLVQYRGLVTLARTRGMIDPVHCVWPWHVATAVKGARALSVVM